MSETPAKGPGRAKKGSDEETLSVGRQRLKMAMEAFSDSRTRELDDLKFAAADPDNKWQWPADALATRSLTLEGGLTVSRPCLTINKLPQHIKQVTNDQLKNRPAGKVIPANSEADSEVAEVFNGIVRHIEYISSADIAYATAAENQVTYGEGYFRLVTDYCDEDTFDQDILVKRIRNSFSVYMDPMIQDPCGEDAKWCWILEDMTHAEYEQTYPDASPISTLRDAGIGDKSISDWVNENTVRVGEYFHIETKKEKLNLYADGSTAFDGTPEDMQLRMMMGEPVRDRMSDRNRVKWCKTNGYEILEKRDWAGKYIPVIRVIGNEFEIEGQLYISGIVRNAKDPQRMYNYQCSQEVEMLALAPKAPFVGVAGQFEGFQKQWKTANVQNWPYLEYNMVVSDDGQLAPPPQRVQPPMPQTGIIEAKRAALEDIKNATGQYNASLGQVSNERSGKAILARQHEGDVSTYHYGDNLSRAIRALGKKLVNLIPKIYDQPGRVARVIGLDGSEKMVEFDSTQPSPVQTVVDPQDPSIVIKKIYNPTVGKYDVVVVTGKGYATKRQEALESMAQLIQTNPDLWKIAGDLFVKQMDWPGAHELAKRFEKTIDPQLLNDDDDPQMQKAKQIIEQMQQELQKAHQMLQNAHNSIEAREITVKEFEARIKAYDSETKRIVAMKPADPVQGMQVEQVVQPPPLDPNKQMMEESKHALQDKQHEHEAGMARLNAQHAVEQAEQQAMHTQQQAEQQAALQPAPEGNEQCLRSSSPPSVARVSSSSMTTGTCWRVGNSTPTPPAPRRHSRRTRPPRAPWRTPTLSC